MAALTAANTELDVAGIPQFDVPEPCVNPTSACRINIINVALKDDAAAVITEAIVILAASLLSFGIEDEKLQDWGVEEELRDQAKAMIAGRRRARALAPAGW